MASIFKGFGNFTREEITLLELSLETREFKKGMRIISEGDICRSFFYLESGACFQYTASETGETIIRDLHLPGEWCTNYSSFISQTPSDSNLEAYTDCRARELSMHTIHQLIAISQKFFRLGKILAQATSRTELLSNNPTPAEKYDFILSSRPLLLQHFPLKFIASYLGISPETLSRVRRKRASGIS